MSVKKLKPITPGQRHRIKANFDDITTAKPEKSLLKPLSKTGGRNGTGKMTVRHRGGGHKRKYRVIDFKRDKEGIPAKVKTIEYDPNRSARISLVAYNDGEKRYILTPKGLKVGDEIKSGKNISPEIGNALYLSDIPLGSVIHNIELHPGRGGTLARSAGTFAQLTARDKKYATISLPSGEARMVLVNCKATIGAVSNTEHALISSGKAGRSRWLGRRPITRGVSMNPIDHPMGGGEGHAHGGLPRSRNGVYAKGYKTRSKKKKSNQYIVQRRKSKKKKK